MLGQTSWIFLKTVIQSPLNPFQGRAPMSLSFYVKLPPAPTCIQNIRVKIFPPAFEIFLHQNHILSSNAVPHYGQE